MALHKRKKKTSIRTGPRVGQPTTGQRKKKVKVLKK